MATSKKVTKKASSRSKAENVEKLRSSLEKALGAVPVSALKGIKGADPRRLAVDVNVCKSKCL